MRALISTILLLGVVATLSSGCDTAFSPFNDEPGPPFHVINGFLDTSADTQFVRVQRIRPDLDPREVVLNEFTVESRVNGSNTNAWRDSLVSLSDGSRAHLFFSRVQPTENQRYDLIVTESDGRHSTKTTTIPASPSLQISEPTTNFNSTTQVAVLLGLVAPPEALSVTYHVTIPETSADTSITVPYILAGGSRISTGWRFDVLLTNDRFGVLNRLGRPLDDRTLILRFVTANVVLLSDEWKEALSPTAQITDFFGTIGRYSLAWTIDSASRVAIGYAP